MVVDYFFEEVFVDFDEELWEFLLVMLVFEVFMFEFV